MFPRRYNPQFRDQISRRSHSRLSPRLAGHLSWCDFVPPEGWSKQETGRMTWATVKAVLTWVGQSSVSCRSNWSQISQNILGGTARELTPLKTNSVDSSKGWQFFVNIINVA